MATTNTTLCNQQFTNSVITANGVFNLFVGNSVSNTVGFPSMRVVIDFSDPNPLDGGAINTTYAVTAVLEGQQDGLWYPIAYQFEPYRGNPSNGPQRVILMQPSLSTLDTGIDDIVWVGDTTIARISRQQGRVPASLRLRLVIKENGFGGSGAFQGATIKALLELSDVA